MARGVASRLRKIEEKTRPKGAKLYVVWGRDQAEVDRIVTDARKAGLLRPEDKPAAGIWTRPSEMPRSRWTTLDGLSPEELDERIRVIDAQLDEATGGKGRETFIQWAREHGRGELADMMERGEL